MNQLYSKLVVPGIQMEPFCSESRNSRFKSYFSGLFSKSGLEIRKNFQAEPLAKPENSIKFPTARFGENPAKEFRNSELFGRF